MYSGSLFWNELIPRILTVLRDPGDPLASTVTPGTAASSRCSTLAVVGRITVSVLTLATAPVMSARRCSVYPVTVTSSRYATGSIVTSILERPFTSCETRRRPTSENVSTASGAAVNE